MMWLAIVMRVIPFETIIARLVDLLLSRLGDENQEKLNRSVEKASETMVMLSHILADNKVSEDEINILKHTIQAWAKGDPTPEEYKAKYR